ncbi:hypothetical protein BJX99DRAFT_235315 [Aspergillus californicus]
MRTSILPPLALAALAAADDASTTTAPYYGPSWTSADEITLPTYSGTAGSVVSVNALETTYAISCLDSAETSLCKIDDAWTMVQGISSYDLSGVYTAWDDAVTVTRSEHCTFTNYTISASCSLSVSYSGSQSGAETSYSASTSDTFATDAYTWYGLEVTGGVEKLSEPEATETPGGAAPAGGIMGVARAMVTAAPMVAAGVVAML